MGASASSGEPDVVGRGKLGRFDAITLDFYGTLVFPKVGRGRGAVFMDYLREQGVESDPWEHQALYDVFERHGVEYDPNAPVEERERYYLRLAERVFRRLNVQVTARQAATHAAEVWRIFGPDCLAVFPDVSATIGALRAAGYPLALVSNWQRGLRHFCVELGLSDVFDHVLASAEVGYAKPDPRIFEEASRRLGCPPDRVLHVGDSLVDDVEGALSAGLQVVYVLRGAEKRAGTVESFSPLSVEQAPKAQAEGEPKAEGAGRVGSVPFIQELSELTRLLDLEGAVA